MTGESLPVSRDIETIGEEVGVADRHNMVFCGTAVTDGRGLAIITFTGMHTEMGHIAGMFATDGN